MKFLNPESTIDYVCRCDRDKPKDEQVVFELTTLTIEEEALISNTYGYKENGEMTINLGDQTVLALNLGLAGIRNAEVNGKPLELVRDEVKKFYPGTKKRPWKTNVLNMIPPRERQEIAEEIKRLSNLTEEEEKN